MTDHAAGSTPQRMSAKTLQDPNSRSPASVALKDRVSSIFGALNDVTPPMIETLAVWMLLEYQSEKEWDNICIEEVIVDYFRVYVPYIAAWEQEEWPKQPPLDYSTWRKKGMNVETVDKFNMYLQNADFAVDLGISLADISIEDLWESLLRGGNLVTAAHAIEYKGWGAVELDGTRGSLLTRGDLINMVSMRGSNVLSAMQWFDGEGTLERMLASVALSAPNLQAAGLQTHQRSTGMELVAEAHPDRRSGQSSSSGSVNSSLYEVLDSIGGFGQTQAPRSLATSLNRPLAGLRQDDSGSLNMDIDTSSDEDTQLGNSDRAIKPMTGLHFGSLLPRSDGGSPSQPSHHSTPNKKPTKPEDKISPRNVNGLPLIRLANGEPVPKLPAGPQTRPQLEAHFAKYDRGELLWHLRERGKRIITKRMIPIKNEIPIGWYVDVAVRDRLDQALEPYPGYKAPARGVSIFADQTDERFLQDEARTEKARSVKAARQARRAALGQ